MGDLSKNFSKFEFRCHHCGKLAIRMELVEALEKLRSAIGDKVLYVTCGYRCVTHNKAIGGEENSQHVLGSAADVRGAGVPLRKLYEAANVIPGINGLGLYPDQRFVHVDVRRVTSRASWGKVGQNYVTLARAEKRLEQLEVAEAAVAGELA